MRFHTYRESNDSVYCNWQGKYSCGSCGIRGTRVAPTVEAGLLLGVDHPDKGRDVVDSPMYWVDGDLLCGSSPRDVIDTLDADMAGLGMHKVYRDFAEKILLESEEDKRWTQFKDRPDAVYYMEDGIEELRFLDGDVLMLWEKENLITELVKVQTECEKHNVTLHWI